MRKVTRNAVDALLGLRKFSGGNTSVHVEAPNRAAMYLHGNLIAERIGAGPDYTLILRDAGWRTVTTKERLNGILETVNAPRIYQRDFAWYLDGLDAVTGEPRRFDWRGAAVIEIRDNELEHWYTTTRDRAGAESFNARVA